MTLKNSDVLLNLVALSLAIVIGVLASLQYKLALGLSIFFLLTIGLMIVSLTNVLKMLTFWSMALVLSLYLLPGFTFVGIGLRVDDFITIFLTIILFFIFLKEKKYKVPSVLKWLSIYLAYSLMISVVHIAINELHPIYMLFFIKEIQYFVYFLTFYYLAKNYEKFSDLFRKIFLISAIITICWGVFQLVTGNIIGYYGIGIISVSAPSQSGVVLMLTSILLLYMSVTASKKSESFLLTVALFLSIALTFATISRTAILILVVLLSLYIMLSMLRKWNIVKVAVGVYFLLLLTPLGFLLIGDLFASVIERFSRFEEGARGRFGFWQEFLNQSDLIGHIFGNGKGFMQVIVGTFTLKADSQYVRLILEVGIVGLILWGCLIGSVLVFCFRNLKSNYHDSLFLLIITFGFILIGVTQEGYLVAIQGSLYWILTGFLIGKMIRQNELSSEESRRTQTQVAIKVI